MMSFYPLMTPMRGQSTAPSRIDDGVLVADAGLHHHRWRNDIFSPS
jgi:hypothetical protein